MYHSVCSSSYIQNTPNCHWIINKYDQISIMLYNFPANKKQLSVMMTHWPSNGLSACIYKCINDQNICKTLVKLWNEILFIFLWLQFRHSHKKLKKRGKTTQKYPLLPVPSLAFWNLGAATNIFFSNFLNWVLPMRVEPVRLWGSSLTRNQRP